MMMQSVRQFVAVPAVLFLGLWVPAMGEPAQADKLKAAAAAAADFAGRAHLARDVSLKALENALAARDEAEAVLVDAFKSADKSRIRTAEGRVKQARRCVADVCRAVAKISLYVGEALGASACAEVEIKKAIGADTPGQAAAAVRKVEDLAGVAGKAVGKAEKLTEALKKEWLIPLMGKPTTATPTAGTTQPSRSAVERP